MHMNKTDLIFYLSTLAGAGSLFVKLASPVVTGNTLTWVSLISTLIAFVAYEFYEFFTGKSNPPTPPTI